MAPAPPASPKGAEGAKFMHELYFLRPRYAWGGCRSSKFVPAARFLRLWRTWGAGAPSAQPPLTVIRQPLPTVTDRQNHHPRTVKTVINRHELSPTVITPSTGSPAIKTNGRPDPTVSACRRAFPRKGNTPHPCEHLLIEPKLLPKFGGESLLLLSQCVQLAYKWSLASSKLSQHVFVMGAIAPT